MSHLPDLHTIDHDQLLAQPEDVVEELLWDDAGPLDAVGLVYGMQQGQYDDEQDYYQYPQTYVGSGQVHKRLGVILVWVLLIFGGSLMGLRSLTDEERMAVANDAAAVSGEVIAVVSDQPAQVVTSSGGGIAPLFTREVQYWAPKIVEWAAAHDLDPNMVATVMQIESCGDPNAVSIAGAQGLFQVMPFHFGANEVMQDPDTNARRGMNYLAERLVQTNGDVGRAFAGYNGGHVAAGSSWDYWAHETQRYFIWSTGIYADAQQGAAQSETLGRWLQAGGASLCAQAADRLGLPR